MESVIFPPRAFILPSEIIHQVIIECLREHLEILLRKKRNLQYRDEYGVVKDNGWRKELRYFHENISKPRIESELNSKGLSTDVLFHRINLDDTTIDRLDEILKLLRRAGQRERLLDQHRLAYGEPF